MAWLTSAPTDPFIRVAYTIHNLTHDRRVARAYTVLATTDAKGTLLPRTPDDVAALLPN